MDQSWGSTQLTFELQASCLHSLLLAKIRSWAAQSGGCFPVHDPGGSAFTEQSVAKYDGSDIFKWGKVDIEVDIKYIESISS